MFGDKFVRDGSHSSQQLDSVNKPSYGLNFNQPCRQSCLHQNCSQNDDSHWVRFEQVINCDSSHKRMLPSNKACFKNTMNNQVINKKDFTIFK